MNSEQEEFRNQLIQITKDIKSDIADLDGKFQSFIGRGCDSDILNTFHLDLYMFCLYAVKDKYPTGEPYPDNELETLNSLLGFNFSRDIYNQTMDLINPGASGSRSMPDGTFLPDGWGDYDELIPFSLNALIECDSNDVVVTDCNTYLDTYMKLTYFLTICQGLNPEGCMSKIRMLTLYCNHMLSQKGFSEAFLPWNNQQ